MKDKAIEALLNEFEATKDSDITEIAQTPDGWSAIINGHKIEVGMSIYGGESTATELDRLAHSYEEYSTTSDEYFISKDGKKFYGGPEFQSLISRLYDLYEERNKTS